MKLRDAESLLRLVKSEGPLKERWSCETDEGILLEAWPLGFARGSFRLSDAYTVVSRLQYAALNEGDRIPSFSHHFRMKGPHGLWEQELFVYFRELREQMREALKDFWKVQERPRPEWISVNDPKPYNVDFGLPMPAVGWYFEGQQDVSENQLKLIKLDFIKLLHQFVTQQGETYAQGKVVRVRGAASPETDQGPSGKKRVAEERGSRATHKDRRRKRGRSGHARSAGCGNG
jgi:hypothetical protein